MRAESSRRAGDSPPYLTRISFHLDNRSSRCALCQFSTGNGQEAGAVFEHMTGIAQPSLRDSSCLGRFIPKVETLGYSRISLREKSYGPHVRRAYTALASVVLAVALSAGARAAASSGNRFTYLDENDPFYPNLGFPKLTTPQWVGEEGVEAVVILAVDDMTEAKRYEQFLRPILNRLKEIDGRAPVSIMTRTVPPGDEQVQKWLKEGLTLEVHTVKHPCPLLAGGNFDAAAATYYQCIDILSAIPGNKPVAFRMPCCDSMNSPSPRFYAEIFNETNSLGQFLMIDSSVMNTFTTNSASLPRSLVLEDNGRERFGKYLPFPSFATTIQDYPYPYVIGKLCWEFPCAVPSD